VESPLSVDLLSGTYKSGDKVKIDLTEDGKSLSFTKA